MCSSDFNFPHDSGKLETRAYPISMMVTL
jgi:hypothetical protein